MTSYRRFQSAVPNRRGTFPGIFGLTNGLGRGGLLSAEDHAWWVDSNARANGLYADPSTVVPGCYDHDVNPGARAWFRESATELLALAAEYLRLLDRYGVSWVELRSSSPGRIVYADDVQVVAVPFRYPEARPLGGRSLPAVPPERRSSAPTAVGGATTPTV